MSAGLRRSLALWLAGGAALLLLLLARLPPHPAPLARPRVPYPALNTLTLRPLIGDTTREAPYITHQKSAAVVSSSNAPFNNVTSSARAVPADKPSDKPADKPSDKPADKSEDKSPEKSPEKLRDRSVDKSEDRYPEKYEEKIIISTKRATVKVNKTERVVLTKELYVGGHSSPHAERCPALGSGIRLLVLVTTAPAHRAARDAVRFTWGHFAQRSDVAMAFVIGKPPDELKESLKEEDALYGDLVVGNSVDSYSNLTLKTLSMLEWTDAYCPRAGALLKTDDDMFINVPRLLKFIAQRPNATKVIYGKVLKKGYPKRIPKSKYYLSRVQYPDRVLPDFTTGPAYLLTRDAVRPLLMAARDKPYVRLEDVFVTGILANAVGVKRVHMREFYNKKISPHPCAVQRGISVHMVRYHEQFDLWRKLLDNTTKCS